MTTRRGLAAIGLLLPAIAACARRPSYVAGGDCPAAVSLPSDAPGSCRCTGQEGGSVWGTGQYTNDSSVCRAARHAGEVGAQGGMVTVARSGGCARYVGSAHHGVTTASYGPWSGSFYFPARANPSCDQQLASGAAQVATAPGATPVPPVSEDAPPPCPPVLPAIGDGSPMKIRCACTPPIASGPVWGSEPYALDSNPCAAALHAGVVAPGGGAIALEVVSGCARYVGGAGEHGVQGRASEGTAWGFVFGAPARPCPPPALP